MRPEASAYLWDVDKACERIAAFLQGVTVEEYIADELRRSAVERQLLIVGEALNNLRKVDADTAAEVPDLVRIIGLRNVLAHAYAIIDDETVWQAAANRVPELRRVVAKLLADA